MISMVTSVQMDYIIKRMGVRQIKTILSLDREWGKAFCHQTAKRMFYQVCGQHMCIVQHKHLTDNCWCLSDHGMIIKERLIGRGYKL